MLLLVESRGQALRFADYIGLAGMVSMLGACDPGLNVCEEHIKSGLRSPSTYQRVGFVRVADSYPIPKPKVERGNPFTQNEIKRWEEKPRAEIWRYTVDYDAANAFGVLIRGKEVCELPVDAVGFWENLADRDKIASRLLREGSWRRMMRTAYKEKADDENLQDFVAMGEAIDADGRPDCCR